jgi:outer membrane protein
MASRTHERLGRAFFADRRTPSWREEPRARASARSAMLNPRPFGSAVRLAAIALAVVAISLPARADEYKIGVMHVERIMRQSKPAKAAQARIEQEFKARDADITRKEQEAQAATAQFAKDRATLSPADAASRERVLDLQTRDVQRLRQQFAEDLRARQFEELDKLKERLDKVLTKYAKDNHFDLILQDALFVGRSVDITDDVIKNLESTP